jgi:hypothetical protein
MEDSMKVFTSITMFCLMSISVFAAQIIEDATLSRHLQQNFVADESMTWEKIDGFKERFAVTDDQLYRVLMSIYRDAEEKRLTHVPKTPGGNNNKRKIEGVLSWLPKCGDIPVKEFLMDYAGTLENDSWLRRTAILSYLREADATESKNTLFRFLVEGERMNSLERLSIYEYARMVYDGASPEKKAAILAALLASANREEGKIEFMKVDKILAERSAAYRYSRERLAMLERHSLAPPTTNLYTDRDLKAALQECRKYKTHTNISTNLAALKTRNFNLPLPAGATNELTDPVPVPPEVEFSKVGDESKDPVSMEVIVIVLLLAAAGFSVWKSRKSKHQ